MRLICPNCGAQYEVADDVIPEGGRDVQCSNCAHTWFEQPGHSVALEHPEDHDKGDGLAPVDHPDEGGDETWQEEATPDAASQHDTQSDDDTGQTGDTDENWDTDETWDDGPRSEGDDPVDPEEAADDNAEPETVTPPQRRELDPEVADILRQEAEFEQAARAAQADPIETQPEMDLSHDPDEDRRSREARDRLARLRGEPETATAAAAATTAAVAATVSSQVDAPRRELLPDIEEINSTLRPDAPPAAADGMEDGATTKSGGFRRGFVFIVALFLIALAVYVFAPQISAALPQVEPMLTAYVEWVNGLRLWLDAKVSEFVAQAGSNAEPEAVVPAE
ncbi:zinc-ribbon domain-containing protein [Pseudooctadecabacter jejudonensis]|uniref:Zinc finger/thioredoxin putative domain-containing protein n=1 Tax=Pseudooctadecabacter jejudonensis TaxID=1391910 RepID=A0A1Y5T2Q7_9RHOB|nr:zinc-ribbon domain-containing protein [Pseudooctadecabacter jejudonensis]SLN54069.1 hypothetical protein PSJ8397_02821 [Pseudooctadecabacter jejudonensis]